MPDVKACGRITRAALANSPLSGLVQKRVAVHKPDAQAKDTALCKTTSRNKRLPEWFESLEPSLARQACRLEVVTLPLTSLNRADFCCRGKLQLFFSA